MRAMLALKVCLFDLPTFLNISNYDSIAMGLMEVYFQADGGHHPNF